jgi:5-methyltetrahydrofolate--homocysteine methyltransferase
MSQTQFLHRIKSVFTKYARTMHNDPSKAENILWQVLRNRQIHGLKFRRKHVLGNYIVDFYCVEHNLVIEVDGDSHADQEEYDLLRTSWLASKGYQVVRFTNFEVLENLSGVVEKINEVCSYYLVPLPEGERLGEGKE